jgi:predicted outer membrane repeat protein
LLGFTTNVTLINLKMRDGKGTGGANGNAGGAIYAAAGTNLALETCLFTNNEANSGGAVYAAGGLSVRGPHS